MTSEVSPVFRLIDEYDRATRELSREAFKGVGGFQPRFDVRETKEAYELSGELPGIEQKDINIEWQGSDTLTVSGRTEHRSERGTPPKGFVEGEDKSSHQPTVEDEAEGSNAQQSTQVATTGSKEVQKSSSEGRYWITERSVGEYSRSFSFPTPVDHDAVKASLKNGVLSIVVPKAKPTQPKKITIE
jgi:HSP20 family molecular chaperone IbpA